MTKKHAQKFSALSTADLGSWSFESLQLYMQVVTAVHL